MIIKRDRVNSFVLSDVEGFKGLPEVDVEKCTGCGVCSINCPTKAIEITRKGRKILHRVYSGKCIACGRCQEVCPEEAIRLSKKMGQIEGKKSSLVIEKKISAIACEICGTPIASKLQIEKIKEKLKQTSHDVERLSSISICHRCKSLLTKKLFDKMIH